MQISILDLSTLFFSILIIGFFYVPTTWLLLSLFTPKILLTQYFKEPHFTHTETYLMKEFPGFLIRTAIFGWIITFPSLDKKRDLIGIIDITPKWYSLTLKFFIISSQTILLFFTLLLLILLILLNIYEPSKIIISL